MLKGFVLLLAALLCQVGYAQNVGINSTGAAPDASAGLDVSFTDKGFLAPRMTLAQRGLIPSPATGLLVYQTDAPAGLYYYNGASWTLLASNSAMTGWSTTGNSGMSLGTNFVGTTDLRALSFRTNNTERMRITSVGETYIYAGTNIKDVLNVTGTGNNYLAMSVQNLSPGNLASSDVVSSNDDGHYIDMGINSSSYTGSNQGGSNILADKDKTYLYSSSPESFYIGNGYPGKDVVFFTNPSTGSLNGNSTANGEERMRLTGNGDLLIGYTSDQGAFKLQVNTNILANGTTVPSDRRLKENIEPLNYSLKDVLLLEPVKYDWIDKTRPTEKQFGLIAQDARKVIPEIVYENEKTGLLAMNYTELVPVLINAIKEQQKQIDELKQQVQNLKK